MRYLKIFCSREARDPPKRTRSDIMVPGATPSFAQNERDIRQHDGAVGPSGYACAMDDADLESRITIARTEKRELSGNKRAYLPSSFRTPRKMKISGSTRRLTPEPFQT